MSDILQLLGKFSKKASKAVFLYSKFTFICWTVPSNHITFASSSSVSQATFCTFTAPRVTAQVWSHEMITIYIAHTISYKADPSFTGCCSGMMGFHLNASHSVCGLVAFYNMVISQGVWLRKTSRTKDFSSGLCQAYSQHAACSWRQSIWIPHLTVTPSKSCVI